jgi:hypothetical protein
MFKEKELCSYRFRVLEPGKGVLEFRVSVFYRAVEREEPVCQ